MPRRQPWGAARRRADPRAGHSPPRRSNARGTATRSCTAARGAERAAPGLRQSRAGPPPAGGPRGPGPQALPATWPARLTLTGSCGQGSRVASSGEGSVPRAAGPVVPPAVAGPRVRAPLRAVWLPGATRPAPPLAGPIAATPPTGARPPPGRSAAPCPASPPRAAGPRRRRASLPARTGPAEDVPWRERDTAAPSAARAGRRLARATATPPPPGPGTSARSRCSGPRRDRRR